MVTRRSQGSGRTSSGAWWYRFEAVWAVLALIAAFLIGLDQLPKPLLAVLLIAGVVITLVHVCAAAQDRSR